MEKDFSSLFFLGAELKRKQEEEAAALRAQQELEELVC